MTDDNKFNAEVRQTPEMDACIVECPPAEVMTDEQR